MTSTVLQYGALGLLFFVLSGFGWFVKAAIPEVARFASNLLKSIQDLTTQLADNERARAVSEVRNEERWRSVERLLTRENLNSRETRQ
jgi:hypothetical protein